MKKIVFNLIALAVIFTAFTSCTEDNKNGKTEGSEMNLSGSITGTKSLTSDKTYTLTGPVIVEDGGVLNIEAGTTIKAQKGFSKYILVLPGGKINAKGTAAKPIVMTADSESATAGYWGGLIINGKGVISGPSGEEAKGSTEINSAYEYGGTNDSDSSGELTYVKLFYTGARSSGSVEHNGLTLNGVGSGTKIENLYVLEGSDDGIEFFGGAVNVTGLLVVNSDDDMFDFTQGYKGTLKNCYGVWESGYTSTEGDPRGVEADGNLDGKTPTDVNQSEFTIENITIDLKLAESPPKEEGKYMHDVIKVRRGATANVVNALVKGSGTANDLIDITDKRGDANAATKISLTNGLANPIVGSAVHGENSNAKIVSGNNGCATSVFSWTNYKF